MASGVGIKKVGFKVIINLEKLEEELEKVIAEEVDFTTRGYEDGDIFEEDREIVFNGAYRANTRWEHYPQTWDEPEYYEEERYEWIDEDALKIALRKALADNINQIGIVVDQNEEGEWEDD